MPAFHKKEDLYGVQIITGPQSVLLRLRLGSERVADFDAAAYSTEGLYRNVPEATGRARVLEGTDAANREHGTSFHPLWARYTVEAFNDECAILCLAAFAIVERLATCGDEGYNGLT
jgi:hypothetical protein